MKHLHEKLIDKIVASDAKTTLSGGSGAAAMIALLLSLDLTWQQTVLAAVAGGGMLINSWLQMDRC